MQRVNRVRLDRSLAMLCLLAVLWTPVRVCRAEEEPARLLLRVTAEGKEIEGDCVQAALLDPATGESYASFRGLRYTGERAPAAGDALRVYVHGYDLAVHTLGAVSGPVEVRLLPIRHHVELSVEPRDDLPFRYTIYASVHLAGPWIKRPGERSPIEYAWELEGGWGTVRIPQPALMHVELRPVSGYGLLTPHLFWGEWREPRIILFDRSVRLPLDLGPQGHSGHQGLTGGEFIPDFLWAPPVDPARIDSWKIGVHGPSSLRDGLSQDPPYLHFDPPAPCHMFWVVRREPCYLYASPAETRIDLSGMPRQKTILARPTVGGEPLPEGSWLFPGRLDLVSCSSVLELQQSLAGCFLRLGAPDETWEGRTLPAADSLTAWHPDLGLVHYGWKADERPEGALYPGCAVVELAPGRKAIGRVSVYNIWKGTGKIRTTPPEKLLRRSFTEETRTLTFRGLPPGAYSFYFQVFFTDPATGESRKRQGTEEFLITQENPLFRLVLDEP